MTIYQETGISIEIKSSFFASPSLLPLQSLTDEFTGYTHTIDADGGYKSAQFTIAGDMLDFEDWFENGLMRHVEVHDEAHQVIWEGFVNSVAVNVGGLSITRGPVLEIYNRIYGKYSRLDISVSPPVAGGQTTTPVANDAASQALYGILTQYVSIGKVTEGTALQVRDTYLQEHKDPQLKPDLNLFGTEAITVTVNCAGYVEYLRCNYMSVVSTTTQTVKQKLLAALAAEPNSIISTNYTQVEENTLVIPTAEIKDQTIWQVITGLISLGTTAYKRCTLGLYAGRKAVYAQVPTVYSYQKEVRLAQNTIELFEGGEINPWAVLPARWVFFPDFLPGRAKDASLRLDPRAQFIESVTYTAPWGLSMSGGRTDKLRQRLAQLSGTGGGS